MECPTDYSLCAGPEDESTRPKTGCARPQSSPSQSPVLRQWRIVSEKCPPIVMAALTNHKGNNPIVPRPSCIAHVADGLLSQPSHWEIIAVLIVLVVLTAHSSKARGGKESSDTRQSM